MNGAFPVVGATLAIFIAMNWGFSVAFWIGALTYLLAAATLLSGSPERIAGTPSPTGRR